MGVSNEGEKKSEASQLVKNVCLMVNTQIGTYVSDN